jgi:hypothetical protein
MYPKRTEKSRRDAFSEQEILSENPLFFWEKKSIKKHGKYKKSKHRVAADSFVVPYVFWIIREEES